MNRLLAMLFHQGVLDEQFLQLQQLEDESSPNFVSEVVNIYFHESEKLLRNLRGLLMDREFSDYKKMGTHLNQLMGSSSSIGAKRVRNVCVAFRASSEQNSRAGCLRALELLEHEYCYLKNKLHELFQVRPLLTFPNTFQNSDLFASLFVISLVYIVTSDVKLRCADGSTESTGSWSDVSTAAAALKAKIMTFAKNQASPTDPLRCYIYRWRRFKRGCSYS
ncbi:hypothetical protein NC652_008138 [Populus alba x Populus x berolinensis]|uniref:Histidine-containing phosphotransfer protein n=1 Tax=Populus tomentosa TaxID=118781 RepID=A0A8X8A8L8_POPTO|nr:hypothetical protein POTOM_011455 [Populus tomentosa]KAJ6942229.1 hypothetical protein NC652_008138 [Populus alba x Populus x berolinensis]